MKNIFFIFLLRCFASVGQSPEIEWEKSYGGSSSDNAFCIKQTEDSGFVMAGYTHSNDFDVSLNHGESDFWVVKINKLGNIEWQKCYGGSSGDYATTIDVTSDKGYIVAGYVYSDDIDIFGNHGNADYWVIKIDSVGTIQWQKCFGGSSYDAAHVIKQTSDNGYIVAGESTSVDGDATGHHGVIYNSDCLIIKLDSVGNIQWNKSFGGNSNDGVNSIQIIGEGYTFAGYTYSNSGDVSGNHGSADLWIVWLNVMGEIESQKCFGGTDFEFGTRIESTSDSGFIVSASTASNNGDVSGFHGGYADFWVIKIDSLGELEWQKALGGSATDEALSICQTDDSGYIVCGNSGSNDGDVTGHHGISYYSDYWIVKVDSIGGISWQKSIGGTSSEHPQYILKTYDNEFIVAGWSESSDGDVTFHYGTWDFWIVKLSFCNVSYYSDIDGDGFGDLLNDTIACNLPIGYVSDSTDCNDTNELIFPTAIDICNTIDDNCNGLIDEDATFTPWYLDFDTDGFGDILNDSLSCFDLTGYVNDNSDCNDINAEINPSESEICNDIDDNCNFDIDEGLTIYTFYFDTDSDNFGDSDVFINSCLEIIAGYVSDSTDCNDANNLIYPGAIEICDYLDNDCNGIIDDNLTYIHSFEDADGDYYGNIEVDSLSCEIPDGFVEDDSDCDDTNPLIYPGADEILDGFDNNCNQVVDEGVGIDALESKNSISIFPNPANDKIILSINSQFNINSTTSISICDLSGKNILQLEIKSVETKIDVSEFASGIYFVKVIVDGNQFVQKLIID